MIAAAIWSESWCGVDDEYDDDYEQGELDFDAPGPPPHPSLIQPEMTRAVTEDAIYRATFLTDEHRKQEYFEAIVEAARKYPRFIIDQVWEFLGAVGDTERDDGSGMGPIMIVAAKAGIIERVPGETRPSQRPLTHGKPQRLWRSLIYDGPPLDEAALGTLKAKGAELLKAAEEKRRKKQKKAKVAA